MLLWDSHALTKAHVSSSTCADGVMHTSQLISNVRTVDAKTTHLVRSTLCKSTLSCYCICTSAWCTVSSAPTQATAAVCFTAWVQGEPQSKPWHYMFKNQCVLVARPCHKAALHSWGGTLPRLPLGCCRRRHHHHCHLHHCCHWIHPLGLHKHAHLTGSPLRIPRLAVLQWGTYVGVTVQGI